MASLENPLIFGEVAFANYANRRALTKLKKRHILSAHLPIQCIVMLCPPRSKLLQELGIAGIAAHDKTGGVGGRAELRRPHSRKSLTRRGRYETGLSEQRTTVLRSSERRFLLA
jgi:hypothetical protein